MPMSRPEPEPAATPSGNVHETPLCGLIAVDAELRVVAVDPDVELLLGVAERELTGHPLRRLPVAIAESVAGVLSSGSSVCGREIQLTAGDGALHTVSMGVRRLSTSGDNGPLVIVTLLDVTAIRELEANSHRLERLASIGTLSASMAHEIKNGLVAVRTFAELLVRQNKDAELAELTSREVTRIDSIVSQMLRFGGLGRPTYTPLHLNEVTAHACRLIQHQLHEKRIVLKQDLLADPDRVRGDGYQLHQVLLNLFFNALEAMPGGGILTVTSAFVPLPPAAHSGSPDLHSCVRLTVGDTGNGIPAENLARVFEPFFTTKAKGTGLGLPITRRIIKEHGGTISVESTPGQGTTFTLVFPVANGEAQT